MGRLRCRRPGVRGLYVFNWKPPCLRIGAEEGVKATASGVAVEAWMGVVSMAYVRRNEEINERHDVHTGRNRGCNIITSIPPEWYHNERWR